jgi:ABC-type multidrug transport system fused ATPase/permease subunit
MKIDQIKSTLSLLWWSIIKSLKVSPFLFAVENITTIILSVFFIVYSKLQGNLINSFSKIHDGIWIVIIPAIALLSFTVLRDILSYLNWSLIGSIQRQKQEKYYTQLFLHHYSSLDIGRIEQSDFQDLKNKVSDRALWQLQRLPNELSEFVGRSFALFLGAGIIFAIHPLAALFVVVGTIPAFVVEVLYTKARRKVWDGLTTERRAFWSMRSSFESKKTIQELIISNRTKAFLDRIDSYLSKEYKVDFGVEKKFIVPNILVKIIETLSIGGALYFIRL